MSLYWSVSLVISFIAACLSTYQIMIGKTESVGFFFLFFAYCTMFVLGFASIIHAYIRLSQPGISGCVRTTILKRHAAGIIVFILTNLDVFVTVVFLMFKLPFPSPSTWWVLILKVLYFCEGIVSPLLRLYEPAFKVAIVQQFKEDFGYIA
jgi:hypothetical protein